MFGRASAIAALTALPLTLPMAAVAGPTLVVDVSSGRVLHQEEATRPWYPASLSKLMTAYTVFKAIEAGRLDPGTPIRISPRAAKMAPSKMGYPAGTLVTVDDALKMLIVKSANDIAVALAEGVSGSVEAFAGEMNGHSRALGMSQSSWVNPNGLPDPRQVTSARDMAILARALIRDFPQYQELFGIQALQAGKRVIRTHNALVYRYPGADGMKTGFICASGFNIVATAHRGSRRLIAVVLGATSAKERNYEAAALFEKGFGSSGSFSFFGGGGGATLASLSGSGYAGPTDIREQACGRKKGGSRTAEREDAEETELPTSGRRKDGVMATLLTQQKGVPVAKATDGYLLTSWTIAPPVPVGPYNGPLRPAGQAAVASAADPDGPGAAAYADTPQKALVVPGQPVAASVLPAAPGAIRPGAAASGGAAMPGQIPRRGGNPLETLASDPLTAGSPASAATQAELDAVPMPVPRPETPARPRKKKKPAPKS
jgi:D-alanyl-D-alanine carboxypeptidase